MARTPLSFEDYFEKAFTDAPRSEWVEDLDNNFDLFDGKTFTIGPTNADYLTVDNAIDAAPANDHVLYLLQTGTHTALVASKVLLNKQIVLAPLSGVYGDVIFNTPWNGTTMRNSVLVFDKIKFSLSSLINGCFDFYATSSGYYSRVLFNGSYLKSSWNSNDAAKLGNLGFAYGSPDSAGTHLTRFTFLACTAYHVRTDTGVNANNITSGNVKYEFRRTVYNRSTIKDLESSYVPAFDIEDLSTTETATHGADAALTVLPLAPNTLGYISNADLQFSAPIAQADLATQLLDTMTMDDTHFYEWFRKFSDQIRLTDGLGIMEVFYESIVATDTNSSGKYVTKTVAEVLSLVVVLDATQSYALREQVNLTHDIVTELTTAKIINESLDLADRLFAEFVELILEDIHLNESHVSIPQRIMTIYEAMGINENPHYSSVFARNIAEAINILDGLETAKGGTIAENITFSVAALKLVLASILTDICEVTSSTTDNVMITAISNDKAQFTEDFEFSAILNRDIHEDIIFAIGIPLEDKQFATYVINTESVGISEYTNFNFNSISGEYAATETGIYKLTGDTDDGTAIIGSIKTGLMNFGTSLQKQIPYAYIGCHTDGRMVLKVSTTYKGQKKERWYTMNQRREAIDTVRIKLGKGIKSTYYQFELVAIDGADFSVDKIELLPLSLKRRI